MAPREPFGVRLPEELEEELTAFARSKGKTLSAACRELMQSALDEQPGFLREKLRRSLTRARTLLLHGQDAELVEDVDELIDDLEGLEEELEENPGSEHESDDNGEDEDEAEESRA